MIRRLVNFFREDLGQDLVEYTLLIAFLAIAAIAVLSQVGITVQGPWRTASTTFASANGSPAAPASGTNPPADPTGPSTDGGGNRGDHDGHGEGH